MAKKYHVLFIPAAEKDLDKLETQIGDRIFNKIKQLEINPRPSSSKKLKGEISHRLRVGDYRVIYEIDDSKAQVMIYRVRHRKEVYK